MSTFTLNNVGKIYNPGKDNACEALKDVSLKFEPGDLVAITGESGSGKSTLLHLMGCLDTPTSGEIFLDEIRIDKAKGDSLAKIRNSKIGFVLQDFGLILNESALKNVCVPLMFSSVSPFGMKSKAMEALKMIGIEKLARKPVNQLSGGQKQRVAIARAIVNDPDIILADEPTGSLDHKTSSEIMEVLLELNRKGKTLVVVTHDREIAGMCRRRIELSDGKIISET